MKIRLNIIFIIKVLNQLFLSDINFLVFRVFDGSCIPNFREYRNGFLREKKVLFIYFTHLNMSNIMILYDDILELFSV